MYNLYSFHNRRVTVYFIQVYYTGNTSVEYLTVYRLRNSRCMYSLYSLHSRRVYVYFKQATQLVNVCTVYTGNTTCEYMYTLHR